MKKYLLSLALLLGLLAPADAATCFWVGGTATWNTSNIASWSSGTGGAGSTCAATGSIPKQAGDVATFDNLSGGGTVTVAVTGLTVGGINLTGFTGTLDFNANTISPTFTATANNLIGPSGAYTLLCGTGTFTFQGLGSLIWQTTSGTATITCSSTPLVFAPSAAVTSYVQFLSSFAAGSFGSVTFTWPAASQYGVLLSGNAMTIATLAATNVPTFALQNTLTITNAPTIAGASVSKPMLFLNNTVNTSTRLGFTMPAGSVFSNVGFMGMNIINAPTNPFTSCYDLGNNAVNSVVANFPASCAAPATGSGGGKIIGG